MERNRAGSDPTAAGGGGREVSEWQRSIAGDGFSKPRKISGTATGQGSNDYGSAVHELPVRAPDKVNPPILSMERYRAAKGKIDDGSSGCVLAARPAGKQKPQVAACGSC